jgi:acyl-CoA reductase-like NAD-dependent aldehyde dehydrogenase
MTMTDRAVAEPLYIGGAWRRAAGTPLDVIDPTNEQVLATVPSATAAEVHEALTAARGAQAAWARTPSVVRGQYLRAIADLIRANRGRLAELIVSEVGKPVAQAADEVDFAAAFLSYNAEWDRRLEGETLPADVPGELIQLSHAPLGVVAAICPWNFPLAVLCRKLGPALVTGNTVVVKPSEVSPLSTIELFRLIDAELDLPPGVLNLVTGGGAPADDSLRQGYWYVPAVLRNVRPDMTVMREETFGPVTPVLAVSSVDQAISLANDSRYGLSAYVFSRDYQAVMRAVEELQFGEIYINRTLGESIHAHHAGYRESGIGGEDGKWGLLRYTQIKTAYHHYG